ncbi:bifunctional hydroxymethylpyrimidine kinase/phosphomethylpyrimidine kinase [Ramlibacter sp. WS9]|uniref:bifunctional hydroxymethylpyrimidine kinase/phosphomethylpyrimidine kinase n=1 Tax=Ramlibacter sp. WS9 TaxID=1882741 RepID=UPI001141B56B|nr:bifunctional hydroxymethylpyrimidine kinase/phosphomethylpyrimidine kinase [Ramlibacter sp. WS9]ROZ72130.1 bifunctional hydroxymethylpyrimidine kinase/phosphomethylpyrimidine kinase [Ramlibacter sp. WS9]
MSAAAPPIVWTVAGSDCGGGAGLQADLRAFDAFGVHGCSVVAAVTAQNSVGVERVDAVSADLLDAQLAALAVDMPPAAIKTGLLGSTENLRVLAAWIDRLRERNPSLAVVVDPVLRSSTGASFANEELLQAYREELLPRATLVTPNRAEAAALLGVEPLRDRADVEQAARALREAGCGAVTITGGDAGSDCSEDYASTAHASGWLTLPRVATSNNHGTGCVFAASAASAIARGFVPMEAVILAKMATTEALRHGYAAGAGAGPVRPHNGFALRHENLPALSIPGPESVPAFSPLASPELGLYAVVDSAAWVRRVLAAGVRTVQLRIKDPSHPALRGEVRESVAVAREAGAQLFINDHWRVAIEEGAYGVHLGQEDLAQADLAAISRAGLRLGISTHCYWEVCRAWALKPSYIACGPIHPTQAKAMPWIPQGNGNLAYWCALLPLPVVAIAGMDESRAAQAAQCGASGVAVISAITAAPSSEAAMAQLQRAIGRPAGADRITPPALPRPTLSQA